MPLKRKLVTVDGSEIPICRSISSVPRVEGVREEYTRRLKAQQEGLAAMCASADFGFAIHRTDHSPEAALLGLYMALTAR